MTVAVKPFIKFVGGKTRLVPELLKHVPQDFRVYYEPMVGGGALFWALVREGLLVGRKSHLSDSNIPLIQCYRAVRDDPETVVRQLKRLVTAYRKDGEGTYYRVRKMWNKGVQTPARFIFLKQTSFNGLWRYNKDGEINMPWGHYESPRILDADQLRDCSWALQRTSLYNSDVSISWRTIERIHSGDLVYFDPPYWGCFDLYTKERFTEERHVKLLRVCNTLVKNGVHVIYTNEDSAELRELLRQNWKNAQVQFVESRRYINRDGQGRKPVPDLIVSGPVSVKARKNIPAKSVKDL